jgi:hypothetical protein
MPEVRNSSTAINRNAEMVRGSNGENGLKARARSGFESENTIELLISRPLGLSPKGNGQVRELLDILPWASSFEGFALRLMAASYSWSSDGSIGLVLLRRGVPGAD